MSPYLIKEHKVWRCRLTKNTCPATPYRYSRYPNSNDDNDNDADDDDNRGGNDDGAGDW